MLSIFCPLLTVLATIVSLSSIHSVSAQQQFGQQPFPLPPPPQQPYLSQYSLPQQFTYPYQQQIPQQQFSQFNQFPGAGAYYYGSGNNYPVPSAYSYNNGYPFQQQQQQYYFPNGGPGYAGQAVAPAGVVPVVVPVREGPEYVAATPVIPVAPVVEAPEGGHYEIYEYGRDELDRQSAEFLASNVGGPRMKRPFSVIRKPHYEIYKWGRSGYY